MGRMKLAGERLAVRMRALGQPWELALFLCLCKRDWRFRELDTADELNSPDEDSRHR